MPRFEVRLPEDVITVIRQSALDRGVRPQRVVEDLVRKNLVPAAHLSAALAKAGALKMPEHLCNACGAALISTDAPCPECGAP